MESQETTERRVKEICTACGGEFPEGTGVCSIDGMELMRVMTDPLIGTVLPRRYRILALAGRGSMSVVYRGVYEPLDQPVAIKMLKSHLVSDPHQMKRFQQEAKTAGGLNHPNIVGVLDFGVTDQGVPYLIMEHVQGQSLAELIHRESRIPVNRAVKIFRQAADALGYAHKKGVVHRDIKPSNILIVSNDDDPDFVKVVDFGIAKVLDSDASGNLTKSGEVLGTPLYMSPEQSMGKPLDGRSDIYSLGCVMYEAITGRPPFVADTAFATIRKQISATAQPLDMVRPDLYIPEKLKIAIAMCLEKDVKARYQTMEELVYDLESLNKRPDSKPTGAGAKPSTAKESLRSTGGHERVPEISDDGVDMGRLSLVIGSVVAAIVVLAGAFFGISSMLTKQKPDPQQLTSVLPPPDLQREREAIEKTVFQGNLDKAQQEYEALLVKYDRQDTQPQKATILNDLCTVAYLKDKYKQAEALCTQSLQLRESIKQDDPVISDNWHNLALIKLAQGDINAAERYAQKAYDMRAKAYGPTHLEVADSLEALAQISCEKQKFSKAQSQLEEALSIKRKALGDEHPEVATLLHDLGMVFERQKKNPTASQYYSKALGIRQKQLGLLHPAVADTMCAIATMEYNRGNDEAAESMFKSALEIRQKSSTHDGIKSADLHSCLGFMYDNQKKYQLAEVHYRKALEIREAILGTDSPKLVKNMERLAAVLRKLNQPTGAEYYEQQIQRIRSAAVVKS